MGALSLYFSVSDDKLDLNVFDDPLSPEAKYWIGFLLADGCISKTPNGWAPRVALKSVCEDQIIHFQLFLNTSYQISSGKQKENHYINGRRVKNQRIYYSICVYSHALVSRLQELGISYRKSAKERAVRAVSLNRDFWRGYFDGDGTISFHQRTPTSRHPQILLYGSELLCQQFVEFLRRNGVVAKKSVQSKKLWRVKLACQKAISVLNLLYKDFCVAHPDRVKRYKEALNCYH